MSATHDSGSDETAVSPRSRIVGLALLGLIGVALIAGLVAAWMMQQPYKYYVRPPADRAARDALAADVARQLDQWRELDKTPEGHAMAADDDRLWPLDRLPLVLAIENYYLKNGALPANTKALKEAGLLPDPSLADRCKVIVKNDQWELRAFPSDYLTAVGN